MEPRTAVIQTRAARRPIYILSVGTRVNSWFCTGSNWIVPGVCSIKMVLPMISLTETTMSMLCHTDFVPEPTFWSRNLRFGARTYVFGGETYDLVPELTFQVLEPRFWPVEPKI